MIYICKRQVLFVSSAKSVVDKGDEDFFDIDLNVSIAVAHSFDDLVRKQLLSPECAERLLSWRPTGVTLFLLWTEYKPRCPEGVQYSRFCELYRRWSRGLKLSMRQERKTEEEP